MKNYILLATGNVQISPFGDIRVDGVKPIDEFVKSLDLNKENFETKQFAGKVEIVITDLSAPLKIIAKEC